MSEQVGLLDWEDSLINILLWPPLRTWMQIILARYCFVIFVGIFLQLKLMLEPKWDSYSLKMVFS